MGDSGKGNLHFLQAATPALLESAVAANHREYFIQYARAARGEVHEAAGVAWTDPGPAGEPMVLFPQLDSHLAGQQLDTIVQFYRQRQPNQLVGCWSLAPPQPHDLDVRLLARGFQPGWRPCWMWLDLHKLATDCVVPEGVRIELLETAPTWEASELPYYHRATAAIEHAMGDFLPRRIWHFVAWLAGEPVGHSTLFLTYGRLGVAGIYGVGVVPGARDRGIGKAVTAAVCRHAQSLGCRHALLNATGERMYRQLGFERIGYGWTWWLNVDSLNAHPPSPARVALAEAIGRGDLGALAALARQGWDEPLDAPLANRMTLLELAAHAQQPVSAEWLVDQGAALELLPAWDLGWRERVVQLLAAHPELANRRSGELQSTPLHAAVERDDRELARVLLAARPDLGIKDGRYGGTALDWARHLQRVELVGLIERHQAGS
ncbi:MAG TPA: GNAT family N-acetyltransferase [Roseiflexaceae bacterium]|nr:GNAT family N-acetyltransferase [Roseiflexaceae bacterium]